MNFFAGLITHPRSSYSGNPEFQQLQQALSRLTEEDRLFVAETDSFTHADVPPPVVDTALPGGVDTVACQTI